MEKNQTNTKEKQKKGTVTPIKGQGVKNQQSSKKSGKEKSGKAKYESWKKELKPQEVKKERPPDYVTLLKEKVELSLPRVCLTPEVKSQIDTYTHIAPDEYSLFGLVTKQYDSGGETCLRLIIDELFFPKQVNTSGSSEVEDHELGRIMSELAKRNNGDEKRLRAWIHSHGNMGPFWSGTDKSEMSKLIRDSQDYYVYIVVSKKGTWTVKLDIWKPFKDGSLIDCERLEFDDLGYDVLYPKHEFFDECVEMFRERAKRYKYTKTSTHTSKSYRSKQGYANPTRRNHDPDFGEYLGYGNYYGTMYDLGGDADDDEDTDPKKEGVPIDKLLDSFNEIDGSGDKEEEEVGNFLNRDCGKKPSEKGSSEGDSNEVAAFIRELNPLNECYHPLKVPKNTKRIDAIDLCWLWHAYQYYLIDEVEYIEAIKALEKSHHLDLEDLLKGDVYSALEDSIEEDEEETEGYCMTSRDLIQPSFEEILHAFQDATPKPPKNKEKE